MSGINVVELEMQRAVYVSKKQSAERKLKNLETSYDSLVRFKGDVSRSQGDFASLNQSKSSILSRVEEVKQNCKTAQKYHAGMQNILDGIGTKIIGAMYRGMLASIQIKQRSILDSIDEQEISKAYYKKKINEIDAQIAEAKSQNQC